MHAGHRIVRMQGDPMFNPEAISAVSHTYFMASPVQMQLKWKGKLDAMTL